MKVKWMTLIIILGLLLVPFSAVFALHYEKTVTPYGDFCPHFSHYGIYKFRMSTEEARTALKDYYDKKGLFVMIEDIGGRFIKAKIMDKGEVVDIIILDRRTGRIRSIY